MSTTDRSSLGGHPSDPTPGSGASTVDTSGNAIALFDPTTGPNAKPTQKLAGDIKGAAQGVIGGAQAALGATIRNKKMADAGFEKMSAEDQRLGAKHGVPTVGSDTRKTTTGAGTGASAGTARGVPGVGGQTQ